MSALPGIYMPDVRGLACPALVQCNFHFIYTFEEIKCWFTHIHCSDHSCWQFCIKINFFHFVVVLMKVIRFVPHTFFPGWIAAMLRKTIVLSYLTGGF